MTDLQTHEVLVLSVWSASSRGLPGTAASFPGADALGLFT